MRISVIGLGKLGAPWAATLASKGHTVIGVDSNPYRVAALNRGTAPVAETDLNRLINESRHNLSATTDIRQAVLDTQVTFLVVPTPSEPHGAFSLCHVRAVMEAIGTALKEKVSYHLVVVTSTVMPGDMDTHLRPALQRSAERTVGENLGLCYNPEFIALGSVIHDMLYPDFILIGESDPAAGGRLEEIHRGVCGGKPRIARMNFVNAEIAKLAVNTFVTTKISYANMLARVCEQLPGADADVVTSALGLDSRIGRKYLKGAVSYGGPCFPRDNLAFAALGARLGVRTLLAEVTDQMNREQMDTLAKLVLANLRSGGSAGILGLSYKPNTSVCEASAGVNLAQRLLEAGVSVIAYDPAALDEARKILGQNVVYASSAADCARRADVLVVTVAWSEFATLGPDDLRRPDHRPIVIDCWRLLKSRALEAVANIVVLGMGPPPA